MTKIYNISLKNKLNLPRKTSQRTQLYNSKHNIKFTAKNSNSTASCLKKETIKKVALIGTGIFLAVLSIVKRKKLFSSNKNIGDKLKKTITPTNQQAINKNKISPPQAPEIRKHPEQQINIPIIDNKDINFDFKNPDKNLLSSKIYKATKVKSFAQNNHGHYILPNGLTTEHIPNLQNIDTKNIADCKEICKDFIIDVLVANNDVVNTCKKQPNGEILRLNFSKTLGNSKEAVMENLKLFPTEISEFLNQDLYPQNASVYKYLTRENIIDALKQLKTLDEENYPNGLYLLYDKIVTSKINIRKKFIKDWIKIVKDTPQGDKSIQEYIEMTKNILVEESIKKAKNYLLLEELKKSIDNIKEIKTKDYITNIYKERIKELETTKIGLQYRMGKLLKNNLYKQNKITEDKYKQLVEQFGEKHAQKLKSRILEPLSTDDILEAAPILIKTKDKYKQFWKENPELLAAYINAKLTKASQALSFNETQWNTITNYLKDLTESTVNKEKFINAIIKYNGTGSYDAINGILRLKQTTEDLVKLLDTETLKNKIPYVKHEIEIFNSIANKMIFKYTKETQQELTRIKEKIKELIDFTNSNEISANINKSILQNKLKEFRTIVKTASEKAGITETINNLKLHTVTVSELENGLKLTRYTSPNAVHSIWLDGEPLDRLLDQNLTPELIEKIETAINSNKPVLKQPEFLSTSLPPYFVELGSIKMNIQMEKGVKYSYVSDISHLFDYATKETESEIIIHPGHTIEIVNAQFKESKKGFKQLELQAIIKPQNI